MSHESILFLAVLCSLAGLPAYSLARMPSLRPHAAWKKALVFMGTAIGLLPLASILALIIMFQVFGIDLVD